MAAGIILYFSLPFEPPLWPALLTLALAFVLAIRARTPLSRAAGLALCFSAAGFATVRWAAREAAPWDPLPRHAVHVAGVVQAVEPLPAGERVTLRDVSLDGRPPLARTVRLRLRAGDPAGPSPGDLLDVRALLRPPPPPAYPGAWDMRRDAFFAGIGGYGFAVGPATLHHAAGTADWRALRAAIADRVLAALPGDRGAIAAVLLTGLGGAIPSIERQAFQDSGLAHLLAVAGLHVGIVMGLFFGLVRYGLAAIEWVALRVDVRRLAAVTALAAGGFYCVLTGAHVPILRSFAMASVVVLGLLTGRPALTIRTLAVAAVVVMLMAPEAVMGVSFQMSFAAVLALVAGAEAMRPFWAWTGERGWGRIGRCGIGLFTTSLLAGTASLPFACYHFGRAALFYVPANLVAVPLTAFWVMPWCLASLFLMPWHAEALALAPAGWGIGGLVAIARDVASWPGAVLPARQMPPGSILLIAAGLFWLGLWRSKLRLAGMAAIIAGGLLAWFWPAPDLVVGAETRVIAAHVGPEVLTETGRGASRFEREMPDRVWGLPATAFPLVGDAASGAVRCSAYACDIRLAGGLARLLRDPGSPDDCRGIALVVAPFAMRGECAGVPQLDREQVWRRGAAAIWLEQGRVAMRFADGNRARPWLVLPPVERASGLPPAATE